MRRIIISHFIILLSFQLTAIDNKFEYLTPDNGLSQANVECIFQDRQGFMWFGTFNGLNRYDGYDIRIYNYNADDTTSVSHEHISSICQAPDDMIWMGTYGNGISVYNPETEKFRRITEVKINNEVVQLRQINAVAIDNDGNAWAIDENNGIFVFSPDLKLLNYFHNYADNPWSLPTANYFGLVIDKKGNIWIGLGNNKLVLRKKGSEEFRTYLFEDRVAAADDGIRSMYVDRSDNIWIGTTSQGAYKFIPENETFINFRKESEDRRLAGNTIMTFSEDPEGNILIGTDGGGINIIDNATGVISVVSYDPGNPESINSNAIYAMYFDASDNLWVGTYAGGVNFYSRFKNKFRKYVPNPLDPRSLSYKNVKTIMQDRDGEIWIGTDGGGLNRFDPVDGTFQHFRMDPSNPDWLQTDVIIHLMQDDEGDIYIGSYNHGLTIFDKNSMTFKQYVPDDADPQSIAGIHTWYIFQDSYGLIWVGMLAVGLDLFDKSTQTFRHFISDINDPTTLNSPNIKIIYEDRDHRLWVGTEGGGLHLFNREEENFIRYFANPDNKDAISNNDVRAIYEDNKGRFWVGTGNGLCIMDRENGTFVTYYKENGLPGNTINGILEDEKGFLWLSTDAGISKFNPDELTFRNYNKTDGLQGNEFNYTSSLIDEDGNFYFGGKSGFNIFKPKDIVDNPHPPRIVITEIQILNEKYSSYPVRIKGKMVNIAINKINKIKLSHKQNIITFRFAALDYGNSGKNEYLYMLEGFDKEWKTSPASQRSAIYTNLPARDYVFKVKASNGDGIWNEEAIEMKVSITPPFYKRTWFILILIAAIIWLVIRYIRRREEVLRRDKEILEKRIQEGLAEVNRQKEEVAQKDKILQDKIESEKEQNWFNVGMSKMSQVMSSQKDDLAELSRNIITVLAEYLNVQQGALYLINDDEETHKYLELLAAYAPDEKRLEGTRIEIGEGQVGTCYKEMRVIRIDNLPSNYATFSSGLGQTSLKYLSVVPLHLNEIVIGVIELLSFEEIPKYMIDFVEKSGETLTSILTSLKANTQTRKLLEKQKLQAEELAAQEEELRQNLEEMQATQEELLRMKEEENKKEEERRAAEQRYMEQLQMQNKELNFTKSLMDALLKHVPDHIYFKDLESKFMLVSQSMAKVFNVKNTEELIGKSDFDFFDEEHAKPAFEDEQRIIKTQKPVVNQIEKEVKKDGSISYVNTSKMPLYDKDGKIIGTFGISSDITEMKRMEAEITMRNEELMAQEEELRQNLEEMQATQEALSHEKSLMDAMMAYVPDHIYFKDLDSKFIMASQSLAKLFNLKSISDLIGKSDFDFFDEEHARPAFEDEQKIIKTGKPIINLMEKEVKKDGSVSYVNTSKLPLFNIEGKIIGTFGISSDITEIKKMEAEISMRNEELLSQEEELRQNLEEMQATQDEILRMRDELQQQNEKLELERIMFMTLMDNISARITYKDTEGRHTRINKTKAKALGLKDESDIYGKTDPEVFGSSHTAERLKKEIEQIKKGVVSLHEVEKFKQKDGVEHWADTSRVPLRNKKGNIIGGLVITWDITDSKNTEALLGQSAAMLESISKELPVVVFEMDAAEKIMEIKGKGLKLLELKDTKTAAGKLYKLFPGIRSFISGGKDIDTNTGKVKIGKKEYNYKYLVLKSSTTTGGYSGYILID